ncbi:hypothetical protein [Vibrio sp. MA40-2]|uniref:hypothetical protein n=1 Tax=Vibrio sp. MA40-2 TaxID=3391828 RepID=UPI0039A61027
MINSHQHADISDKLNTSIGQITIILTVDQTTKITAVKIKNSRPKNIGQILVGKTPMQALLTLPNLFLLCAQAQQTAAIKAIANLNQHTISQKQQQNLTRRGSLEWLKEHNWQLWQMERELFGNNFAMQPSLSLAKLLLNLINNVAPIPTSNIVSDTSSNDNTAKQNTGDDTLSGDNNNNALNDEYYQLINPHLSSLFGCEPSDFLEFTWSEFLLWTQGKAPYSQLLKTLQQQQLTDLGTFEHWNISQENSSLSRQKNHPLVLSSLQRWGANVATRTLARMIEMVVVNHDPNLSQTSLNNSALTSRGILRHDLSIDNKGLITRYSIDAPTDRLFASGGLMEKALLGQKIPEMNLKWIRQLVWAIDPCVEFSLSISKNSEPKDSPSSNSTHDNRTNSERKTNHA